MFRTVRGSRGAPAALLIVLLTLGVALPAAVHGDANDDVCETAGGGAGTGTFLHAASSPIAAAHCGICHWLRSLRVFQCDVAEPLPRLVPASRLMTQMECGTPCFAIDPLPARGPPA